MGNSCSLTKTTKIKALEKSTSLECDRVLAWDVSNKLCQYSLASNIYALLHICIGLHLITLPNSPRLKKVIMKTKS